MGKKKFNFYWIYVILTAVLLGLYFTGPGKDEASQKEIDMGQLIEMLKDGEVEKIELINKENAEIYLKENPKVAKYTYRIGSLERFEETVEQAQKENGIANPIYITNVQRKSWGMDFLIGWLPLIVLVIIWVVIMRNMAGRSGGMGGGQIFNIGKSKAQLFDMTMCL